jgi:peptidoglycan/xylan/chitin deacetylase (PgdA/CDA1 family)
MNSYFNPNDGGEVLPGGVASEAPTTSTSVNPRDAGTADAGTPLKPIPIVLTFDDGPHAAAGKGVKNYTIEIATLLKSRNIVGVFFIQTHVKYRFGSKAGKDVISDVKDLGHVIAIHTGSDDDHVPHTKRVEAKAYDVDGDKKPDGMNGLESDLIRAKAEIQKVTKGDAPRFVRAVGVTKRNKAVDETYSRVGLKHIGVNVDSKDNEHPRPTMQIVIKTLAKGDHSVQHAIKAGAPHLIVLFHDINDTTAASIGTYIDEITKDVKAAGRTPEFTASAKAVMDILLATKI